MKSISLRYSCAILAVSIGLLLPGCNNGLVKVSGKITLENGEALDRGKVVFESGTHSGIGTIEKDGHYTMTFRKPGDGIPPGNYRVLITNAFFVPDRFHSNDDMNTGEQPMLDHAYFESETTPLQCDVPSAAGYDFSVKPSAAYLKNKNNKR